MSVVRMTADEVDLVIAALKTHAIAERFVPDPNPARAERTAASIASLITRLEQQRNVYRSLESAGSVGLAVEHEAHSGDHDSAETIERMVE